MNEQPVVDGFYTSFAQLNIALAIAGGKAFQTQDFAALDWDHAMEGESVPGTGPIDRGETSGTYARNASMSMYYSQAVEFQKLLMDAGAALGLGYMQVRFNIVCHYEPIGQPEPLIYTVSIPGCRLKSEAVKNAPGAAATMIEMPLSVRGIIRKTMPDGTVISPLLVR